MVLVMTEDKEQIKPNEAVEETAAQIANKQIKQEQEVNKRGNICAKYSTKHKLATLKQHPKESEETVILRLMKEHNEHEELNKVIASDFQAIQQMDKDVANAALEQKHKDIKATREVRPFEVQ